MSWPAIVMYMVVACVGLPAAFRNPTALALVIAWLVPEILYQFTGNSLPLSVYFMADITVIAVVYAKSIARCGPKVYPSIRDQLRCLVTDLSVWDRWVVAIFVFGAWPLYILNLHDFYKWWMLWGLAINQFLLAGAEAIQSFRHDVKVRAASDPPGNGLALAGIHWRDG